MRRLGFLLVIVGFLAGALASVMNQTAVRWNWFIPAMVLGFLGVVLVRLGQRREVRATERLSSNMRAIQESLRRIAQNMTQLNSEKQSIDPYDIRHRLEELFADDLSTFIAARETIAHSYGLAAYADVMSCFAAGERYLNRAWCASADGYIDEIHQYLEKAKESSPPVWTRSWPSRSPPARSRKEQGASEPSLTKREAQVCSVLVRA